MDALKGYKAALDELEYWNEPAISAITWMELFAGANPDDIGELTLLVADFGFEIIHTDDGIMAAAARIRGKSIRQGRKIALPDAIIMATSITRGLILITRNKKDFKGPHVRIPYELETTTSVKAVNIASRGTPRLL